MNHGNHHAEDSCLKNHAGSPGSSEQPSPSSTHGFIKEKQVFDEKGLPLASVPTGSTAAAEHSPSGDDEFPEGGLSAWLVVVGSWFAMFITYGIVNTTAAFQNYLSLNQLKDYSPSQVGWIFSVELFMVFFCGIYVGPAFDKHGPRIFVAIGSLASVLSMMLLGLCTQYWQFMLDYAILGGLGGALLNVSAYGCVAHFFDRRRGLATGLACTAGSIGGVVFPLMLQSLIPKIGFAWSSRVLGFVLLVAAVPANLFLKRRLRSDKAALRILPDLSPYRCNPSFTLAVFAMFLMEWGLFMPIGYIASYATSEGYSESFGFTAVAVLNAGSFFGRFVPGWIADRLGRFNTITWTVVLCSITAFALWLPAGNSQAVIIVFALAFGFTSGSNIGLMPVCLSQLCKIEEYGRSLTAAFFFISFATLTSVPIGGALISAAGGQYYGVCIFTGVAYAAAAVMYISARVLAVGWDPRTFF